MNILESSLETETQLGAIQSSRGDLPQGACVGVGRQRPRSAECKWIKGGG